MVGTTELRYDVNNLGEKYYYGISHGVVIMKPFVEKTD